MLKWIIGLSLVLSAQTLHANGLFPEDVVIRRASSEWSQSQVPGATASLEQCRAHIRKAVCWVNPWEDGQTSRPCLPGSEKYAPFFEGHFDRAPAVIQKMYCHVDKIWVEKDFTATAYAGPLYDDHGKMIAGSIGIRQEVLESQVTINRWLSWKEETSFGGPTQVTGPALGIINYKTGTDTKEAFLDYVLNHEFGHLFDFANRLNRTTYCEYKETSPGKWEPVGDCKPLPGSWGEFSWFDLKTPLAEMRFPFDTDICFYSCKGKYLSPQSAPEIFAGIMKTNFASTYASRHPMEDFAESFALYIQHKEYQYDFGVQTQGLYFDLSAHFQSALLESKRNYVEKFLSGPFVYPGQR